VEIFHEKSMKVDAYTLNSNHPHMAVSLERLVCAHVDQITTDEATLFEPLLSNRA